MGWLNDRQRYGWLAIGFHWLTALTVFSLFGLGLYMVELTYYDSLYRVLPDWHRSIGLLLAGLVLIRLAARLCMAQPEPLPTHTRVERRAAHLVHGLLYLLMLGMFVSGYLISTASGDPVYIFDWMAIPSLTGEVDRLEDLAGEVHEWLGWSLVVLAALHGLAALKHHFVDKDRTMRRMLGS